MHTKPKFKLLAAVALACITLSACSEDPAPNSPASTAQPAALAVTPAQALVRILSEISFTATVDTVQYPSYLLVWDFGDGMPADTVSANIVSHIFTSTGQYRTTAMLIDRTTGQAVASVTVPVQVYERRFGIRIVPDTIETVAGAEVQFTAEVLGGPLPGGNSYIWDFGNGMNITIPTDSNTCVASAAYQRAGVFPVTIRLENDFLPGVSLCVDTAWVIARYGPRPDSAKNAKVRITGIFVYKRVTDPYGTPRVSIDTAREFTVFVSTFYDFFLWYNKKPFPWTEDNRIDTYFEVTNASQHGEFTLKATFGPDGRTIESCFMRTYISYESHSRKYTTRAAHIRNIPLMKERFPDSAIYALYGAAARASVSSIEYNDQFDGPADEPNIITDLIAWQIPDTARMELTFW